MIKPPVYSPVRFGSLFGAAGAMLGGGDAKTVEALAAYAYNLGLTFQIVDDILDIIGDPEEMGKPAGLDLAQNRGVMMAQNGDHTDVIEADVAVAELPDDPIARMMAQLRESGAVEIARLQAEETAVRARAALACSRHHAWTSRDFVRGMAVLEHALSILSDPGRRSELEAEIAFFSAASGDAGGAIQHAARVIENASASPRAPDRPPEPAHGSRRYTSPGRSGGPGRGVREHRRR